MNHQSKIWIRGSEFLPVKLMELPHMQHGSWVCHQCQIPDGTEIQRQFPGFRRIGHWQKMALLASHNLISKHCHAPSAPEESGIFLGTGGGAMNETYQYLFNMITKSEAEPTPLKFINSVHNSAAATLAIVLGWRGENRTFLQEHASFEACLWQAVLSLRSGRISQALVTGSDELCPEWIHHFPCRATSRDFFPGESAASVLLSSRLPSSTTTSLFITKVFSQRVPFSAIASSLSILIQSFAPFDLVCINYTSPTTKILLLTALHELNNRFVYSYQSCTVHQFMSPFGRENG